MTHLIEHEMSCDFTNCETVERYGHYDISTCAIDHMHWPKDWVFVTRSMFHIEKYCPLHPVNIGEGGKITISDEPEKVGRSDHRGVISDV